MRDDAHRCLPGSHRASRLPLSWPRASTQRRHARAAGFPTSPISSAVASLALEHGADEDVAVAALLHDAVEDQGGRPTLARIRRRFGARVAEIVEGCTDADTVPKPEWRTRKERYLPHLDPASAEARPGCACD